eukprot:TRINITY_DN20512_c0_g1_i1.p1 TRINITY_DN20512_c0_g1~~TRINITY_DN20512_c0_g1_i1.p1  ORF type:complete len:132 (+),score=12.77 TRINITY_DN20512_c0_g1_i1:52-447(+)
MQVLTLVWISLAVALGALTPQVAFNFENCGPTCGESTGRSQMGVDAAAFDITVSQGTAIVPANGGRTGNALVIDQTVTASIRLTTTTPYQREPMGLPRDGDAVMTIDFWLLRSAASAMGILGKSGGSGEMS